MRIGMIGTGRWGSVVLRQLIDIGQDVIAVYGHQNRELFQGLAFKESVEEVIDLCEAVVLCVPPQFHCGIASKAMEKGRHIFVDKPVAATGAEADHLLALSQDSKSIFMAGHLFCFSESNSNLSGRDWKYGIARVKRSHPYQKLNPYWNIGVHYISLFHCFGVKEWAVELIFDQDFVPAEVTVKLTEENGNVLNWNPTGNMVKAELEHFILCCENGEEPLTGISHAVAVIRSLSERYGDLFDGCAIDARIDKGNSYVGY